MYRRARSLRSRQPVREAIINFLRSGGRLCPALPAWPISTGGSDVTFRDASPSHKWREEERDDPSARRPKAHSARPVRYATGHDARPLRGGLIIMALRIDVTKYPDVLKAMY